MRVETGDGWELRCGDCLDPEAGLASLESVDHVITDPPYSEAVHAGARSSGRDSMVCASDAGNSGGSATRRRTDLGFGHLTPATRAGLAYQVGRVCQRWALVFSDAEGNHDWRVELEVAGLRHYCVGQWRRLNGAPRFNGLGPAPSFGAIEIACRKTGWNGGGKHACWEFPIVLNRGGNSPRLHPTQKPLALMEALVSDFTDPGELICDPFAGSGTTGVACIYMGRRFIGWEKDSEFFETAVKRLRKTKRQYQLFERVRL